MYLLYNHLNDINVMYVVGFLINVFFILEVGLLFFSISTVDIIIFSH